MAEIKIAATSGSGWTSLKGPASTNNQNAFVLPDADGSAGQYLKTDGSKNLGWVGPVTSPNSSLSVTYQTSDLSGATNYDLTFPANCFQVDFAGHNISTSGSGNPVFYLGTASGILSSSHYKYTTAKFGNSSAGVNGFSGSNTIYIGDHLGSNAGDIYWVNMKFKRCGGTDNWSFECLTTEYESNVLQAVYGYCDTTDTITQARFTPAGTAWDSGEFTWTAWSTA